MGKLTDEELAAISERHAVAYDDPWYAPDCKGSGTVITGDGDLVCECSGLGQEQEDADFIAHARRDIPRLLDHIAALQSELDDQRWRYVEDGELPGYRQYAQWTTDEGDIFNGLMIDSQHVETPPFGHLIRVTKMRAWRPLPKPAPVREESNNGT
jgi:hypothetical protein